MTSRRREIPVEESWRMVDGENDSFDTSILPSVADDDVLIPLSSEQPSSGFASQFSSQSQPQGSSQDSIRDFAKHQSDEQVILREPFRPSVPSSVVGTSPRQGKYRTPDPEFRMPSMDVEGSGRKSSGQSSRSTIRPFASGSPRGADDYAGLRRRGNVMQGSPTKRRGPRKKLDYGQPETLTDRIAQSLPSILSGAFLWLASVVGLAFRYAKRPLALLLAIYLSCGAIIMTQNMLQRSILVSLSPLCRIPGASYLNLPFCPAPGHPGIGTDEPANPVEFDDLMNVQSKFEDVLEKTADGVSLPLEMKRSETSLRDLRTLVKHSDIQSRDELMFEFDGFVETARRSAGDLQKFNTHVGSAVDAVISINRWTARYIDSLAPLSEANDASSSSALASWTGWMFFPFQPTDAVFSERILRDKYIEHTTLVSERIGTLILEAQAILRLLTKAEDHLSLIYDISSRSTAAISSRRDEILWTLWTLVGGNARRLSNLSQQLSLLRKVDAQRSSAVAQVSALVLELESIQAGLGDLRERVAEPGVLRDSDSPAASLPLSVHIETIDRGVERLEGARKRIRDAEEDRVREALAKSGIKDEERLIGDAAK